MKPKIYDDLKIQTKQTNTFTKIIWDLIQNLLTWLKQGKPKLLIKLFFFFF